MTLARTRRGSFRARPITSCARGRCANQLAIRPPRRTMARARRENSWPTHRPPPLPLLPLPLPLPLARTRPPLAATPTLPRPPTLTSPPFTACSSASATATACSRFGSARAGSCWRSPPPTRCSSSLSCARTTRCGARWRDASNARARSANDASGGAQRWARPRRRRRTRTTRTTRSRGKRRRRPCPRCDTCVHRINEELLLLPHHDRVISHFSFPFLVSCMSAHRSGRIRRRASVAMRDQAALFLLFAARLGRFLFENTRLLFFLLCGRCRLLLVIVGD